MMRQTISASGSLPAMLHRPYAPSAPQAVRQARSRRRQAEAREFKLMFAMIFFVFLVAAIFSRLKPSQILAAFDPGRERVSVIDEARTAAGELTPYLFQG